MAINKLHDEFHTIDMKDGWEVPPGYPPGIEQKILAGSLDEQNRAGSRTRLLRFAPGIYTKAPFVHTYWEEVYLVAGDLTVGNDAQGEVERRLSASRNSLLRPSLTRARQGTGRGNPQGVAPPFGDRFTHTTLYRL